jgi:protein-S-isoprenylcysteine O-methyltransferase Ste14
VGCCLTGCLRLIFFQIWRLIAAAILAMLLARVDTYVERRYGGTTAGRAYRAYRKRGKGDTSV